MNNSLIERLRAPANVILSFPWNLASLRLQSTSAAIGTKVVNLSVSTPQVQSFAISSQYRHKLVSKLVYKGVFEDERCRKCTAPLEVLRS